MKSPTTTSRTPPTACSWRWMSPTSTQTPPTLTKSSARPAQWTSGIQELPYDSNGRPTKGTGKTPRKPLRTLPKTPWKHLKTLQKHPENTSKSSWIYPFFLTFSQFFPIPCVGIPFGYFQRNCNMILCDPLPGKWDQNNRKLPAWDKPLAVLTERMKHTRHILTTELSLRRRETTHTARKMDKLGIWKDPQPEGERHREREGERERERERQRQRQRSGYKRQTLQTDKQTTHGRQHTADNAQLLCMQ